MTSKEKASCANCARPLEFYDVIRTIVIGFNPGALMETRDPTKPWSFKQSKYVSVQAALSAVYKLAYLKVVKKREKTDVEENQQLVVCRVCAVVLRNLYTYYIEFSQIRRLSSYLKQSISELDQSMKDLQETTNQSENIEKTIISKSTPSNIVLNPLAHNTVSKPSTPTIITKPNSPTILLNSTTPNMLSKPSTPSVSNSSPPKIVRISDTTHAMLQARQVGTPLNQTSVLNTKDLKGPWVKIRKLQQSELPQSAVKKNTNSSVPPPPKSPAAKADDNDNYFNDSEPEEIEFDLNPDDVLQGSDNGDTAADEQVDLTNNKEVPVIVKEIPPPPVSRIKFHACSLCHMSFLSSFGLKSHIVNCHDETFKAKPSNSTTSETPTVAPVAAVPSTSSFVINSSVVIQHSGDDYDLLEIPISKQKSPSFSEPLPPLSKEAKNAKLGHFECSKCRSSFQSAEELQGHAKECFTQPQIIIVLRKQESKSPAPSVDPRKAQVITFDGPNSNPNTSQTSATKITITTTTETVSRPKMTKTTTQEAQISNIILHIPSLCAKAERFYCRLCKKSFMNHGLEFFTHCKEEHFCPTCPLCPDIFFLRRSDRENHILTMHGEDSVPFINCSECDQKFVIEMELKFHVSAQHQRKKKVEDSVVRETTLESPDVWKVTYPCTFEGCGKIFKDSCGYKRHAMIHGIYKTITCTKCDKLFYSQVGYQRHTQRHLREAGQGASGASSSEIEKLFPCSICQKRFATKLRQESHEKVHSKQKQKVQVQDKQTEYPCPHQNCDKIFKSLSALKKHGSVHAGKIHACGYCDKIFSRERNCQIHEAAHEESNYEFNCTRPFCSRKFRTEPERDRHVNRCKGRESNFTCQVCEFKCEKYNQFRNHLWRNHPKNSYECQTCSKKFISKYRLKDHEKIHGEEKTVACIFDGCDKYFFTRAQMKTHRRTHVLKSVLCSHCGYMCRSQGVLNVHLRLHTGQKPYTCQYCQRKFRLRGSLTTHLRIHTKVKPYTCSYCNKPFRQRNVLKCHEQIHTGIKKYKCQLCDRSFSDNRAKKRHMLTHQQEEEEREESQEEEEEEESAEEEVDDDDDDEDYDDDAY